MSYIAQFEAGASRTADRMLLADMFAQTVSTDQDIAAGIPAGERMYIHVVAGNQMDRAAKARLVFSLGHHAEVYEDLEELTAMMPEQGLVLLAEDRIGLAHTLMDKMNAKGIWLPVVVFAQNLDCDRIVAGVKAGVMDYIVEGASPAENLAKLGRAYAEGQASLALRQRQAVARRAVGCLSKREGEVLRMVTVGLSNKEIARELDISPRTVEIHRMKMMTKLGAKTVAQAIRVELEAAGFR